MTWDEVHMHMTASSSRCEIYQLMHALQSHHLVSMQLKTSKSRKITWKIRIYFSSDGNYARSLSFMSLDVLPFSCTSIMRSSSGFRYLPSFTCGDVQISSLVVIATWSPLSVWCEGKLGWLFYVFCERFAWKFTNFRHSYV
jgi:hypothetical protein